MFLDRSLTSLAPLGFSLVSLGVVLALGGCAPATVEELCADLVACNAERNETTSYDECVESYTVLAPNQADENGCREDWDDYYECLLAEHSCEDGFLVPGSPCGDELSDWARCTSDAMP